MPCLLRTIVTTNNHRFLSFLLPIKMKAFKVADARLAVASAWSYEYMGNAESMIHLPAVDPIVSCGDLVSLDIVLPMGLVASSHPHNLDKSCIPYLFITFTVLLSVVTWTQRCLHFGCGGYCGSLSSKMCSHLSCRIASS